MTKVFGLLGRKLGHSFSAKFHNSRFAENGIDAEYRNFEMDSASGLRNLIASEPNLCGLNVTVPFKEDVLETLDEVSAEAREIGAVNTILISRTKEGETRTIGYNTDAVGFWGAISPHIPAGTDKALIFGSGGASKAACHALKNRGIDAHIVSRTKGFYTYCELTAEILSSYRLLVNATPLGMWPQTDTAVDIPYNGILPNAFCFDMVYNPAVTEFMRRCAARGAAVANGLEMLRLQAIASAEIWAKSSIDNRL